MGLTASIEKECSGLVSCVNDTCSPPPTMMKKERKESRLSHPSNRAKMDMVPTLELHKACAASSVSDACRILDDGLAGVNTQDGQGRTAVHFAAARGNIVMIQALLQRGGSIDVRDSDGKTPVMIAAERCDGEMVRYLLAVQKASQHLSQAEMLAQQYQNETTDVGAYEQRKDFHRQQQLTFLQQQQRRQAYRTPEKPTPSSPESYLSPLGPSGGQPHFQSLPTYSSQSSQGLFEAGSPALAPRAVGPDGGDFHPNPLPYTPTRMQYLDNRIPVESPAKMNRSPDRQIVPSAGRVSMSEL